MKSPAEDIASYLVSSDSGLGLTIGQDLFLYKMPTKSVSCVIILDSGGYNNDINTNYFRPMIQVIAREAKYVDAYAKIDEIKDALDGLVNVLLGEENTKYVGIWAQSDIIPLGYDKNNRALVSLNFRIHRTE